MADNLHVGSHLTPGSRVMEAAKKLCDGAELFVAPDRCSAVGRHNTFDEGQDLSALLVEAEKTGGGPKSRVLKMLEQSVYEWRIRAGRAAYRLAHLNDASSNPAACERTFWLAIHDPRSLRTAGLRKQHAEMRE